ncbi:EmrB/QacA family drug resistance transporter, partial [Serratia marcescens]
FAGYLNDVKSLMIARGLAVDVMSIKSTAFAILGKRIARQSEIMAFNDLFLIMGGMMLATALLVMFSSRDFRLHVKKEGKE